MIKLHQYKSDFFKRIINKFQNSLNVQSINELHIIRHILSLLKITVCYFKIFSTPRFF